MALKKHLKNIDILILNHGIYDLSRKNTNYEKSIEINALSKFKVLNLFEQIPNSIGVGDGGNEIGMGNYMEQILELDIYPHPSVIKTSENIIASTSNWGAYGLIAGISLVEKSNFLPSVKKGKELIEKSVELGAVEGLSGEPKPWVDGRSLEKDQICLE